MVDQIKKILFASDLTESSIEVFERTVALASQTGATITMLHVIEDGSSGSQNRMIHLIDSEAYERIRREGQEKVRNVLIGKQRTIPLIQNVLHELCEKTNDKVCGTDNPVLIDAIEVKYGNAAEAITELAETAGCDLIAMGYHKKGSILKALMGKAEKGVMQRSKKPLFLIPLES